MDDSTRQETHGPADGVIASGGKWTILAAMAFVTLFLTLDGGMVSISFPTLVQEFSTDPSTVLWVSTAFFLTTVSLIFTTAWVADTVGRKRLFIAGLTVYVIGLGMAPLAPTVIALILIRMLQAAGTAMVVPNVDAIVTAAFPKNQRGRALGLIGASVGLGLGLGPATGGLLLDALDWRALFWSRVPLGIIGILLAMAILPSDHRRRDVSLRFDYIGPVMLAATATTFLLAINLAGRGGVEQLVVWSFAGASPVLLLVLLAVERRAPRPVLDIAQFRNRVFTISQATLVFHYIANGMVTFLGAFFLINGLEMTAGRAGMVLTVFPAIRVIGAPISGMVADRWGSRIPTVFGMSVLGVGLFMLSRVAGDVSLWGIVAALALSGLGSAFFEPPNTSAIMGSASQGRLSSAGAFIAAGRQVSHSIGFVVAGAIFAIRQDVHLGAMVGESSAARAVVSSFSDAMVVAAALCFVGATVSYFRGRG
ncbi:MAG: MFS transporter [Chloroflexi bacterium]|nr:MFS transporter [Chloroflexota bacterium]